MRIIHILVKQVFRINLSNETEATAGISHLDNGIYLLNITDGIPGNGIVKRILKTEKRFKSYTN